MYGHCFAGIAANEQLDVPAAEDSFRRALRLARGSGGTRSQAARLASALHGGLLYDRNEIAANNSGRADRALLQARLLLAACLSSADRAPEAEDVLAPAAATCARLGLIRLLLDGGPQVVPILEAVQGKLDGGRWRPEWPPIPSTFLADALDAARPP